MQNYLIKMKENIKMKGLFLTIFFTTIFIGCSTDDVEVNEVKQRQFGVFEVLSDDKTIEMDGYIRSESLKNFNDLMTTFPDITKINIKDCDGSDDDPVNLKLSLKLHNWELIFIYWTMQ